MTTTANRAGERARATQEEKSAATRERLLEATVDSLVELGYARTTTIEVAERAGLSRGAMLHHFPSKAALVTAAVRHLATARISAFIASSAQAPTGKSPTDAVIDLLWEQFTSRHFYAALELAVAARTDPELASVLNPLIAHYDELIARMARDFFAHLAPTPELFETGRRHVYYLLHGLALKRRPGENDDEIALSIADLKQLLRGFEPPASRREP